MIAGKLLRRDASKCLTQKIRAIVGGNRNGDFDGGSWRHAEVGACLQAIHLARKRVLQEAGCTAGAKKKLPDAGGDAFSREMAFKHWPLVRDVRFAQKCGRYLRGARKRRPDLKWDEYERIARHFKQDDMGSFAERGYLFQLASDLPPDARVVEVGSWMGASTCFIAGGLKGAKPKIFAVDNFQGYPPVVKMRHGTGGILKNWDVRARWKFFGRISPRWVSHRGPSPW